MHLNFSEHEQMMRKLNKKLNVLKERETILLDLEIKVNILEKQTMSKLILLQKHPKIQHQKLNQVPLMMLNAIFVNS